MYSIVWKECRLSSGQGVESHFHSLAEVQNKEVIWACKIQESLGFLNLASFLLLRVQPIMPCNYEYWERASDLPAKQKSRTYPVPVVPVGALCCPGNQQPRKETQVSVETSTLDSDIVVRYGQL